jgi:hypothetical protein
MDTNKISGFWWLPNNKKDKISGIFYSSPEKEMFLELDGIFPEEIMRLTIELAKNIEADTVLSDVKIPNLTGTLQEKKMWYALAAAMISEENWIYKRVGKRLKLLGLHQSLIQNMPVQDAAIWSKRKNWRVIDKECKKYNI